MSRNKLSQLLVLASLVVAPVAASAAPAGSAPPASQEVPVDDGVPTPPLRAERDAGTRVGYYSALTSIAERDIATAQITIDLAKDKFDAASRDGNHDAAAYWAQRHEAAVAEQREATERANKYRADRDRARGDFGDSAAEIPTQRNFG